MFGNPDISATPVDDLYRSQADVYGNSFANPMNPANMNPGWGIDPSLLSPSYTSSFRPQYSGSNGATDFGRPGFFSSANKLMPWTTTPAWGNVPDHLQPSIDSVSSRPVDGAMWVGQNVVMPYLGFRAAGKLLGGYNMLGMTKHGQAAGRAFGRGLGGGLARGLGASQGGLISRGMTSVMGGTMGAAAGWASPLLLAQGAFYLGEKGIFDPYINTRRSAEDLRNNFAGITFGDDTGHSVTGGGLGGYESSGIARRITRDGIHDMSLSNGQYSDAADMIGRSGLMDNVGTSQISKRIKDSVAQMKLIMSVANMPEMKDAIEQLSKLQKMGANVSGGAYSDAAGAMRQLGGLASIAGTNVQKLMNTVGAQGQYLYQANGMTPYMGQIAAANNYASFAAGSRMGLISSAQLARLGGLEGATQASLTGQLNASQTLYSKINNYNRYMGGGDQGEVIADLNRFGADMARDPMGTYGAMSLYGNQMAANRMSERGSLDLDDKIFRMLKKLPGMVGENGKISFEKAVPYMMYMGMSQEQIMAYGSQRISEKDPTVYNQNMKALNRNLIEQQQQIIEQNTLYGGIIGRNVYRAKKAGRELTAAVGDYTGGNVASFQGAVSDKVASAISNLWYGDSVKSSHMTVEEAFGGTKPEAANVTGFDLGSRVNKTDHSLSEDENRIQSAHYMKSKYLADEINSALKSNDPDARAYLTGKTEQERRIALGKLMQGKKLSRSSIEYLSKPENFKGADAQLQMFSRSKPEQQWAITKAWNSIFSKPEKTTNINDKLASELGLTGTDPLEKIQTVGRAYNVLSKDYDGEKLSSANIDRLAAENSDIQAIMKSKGFTDPQDAMAFITKAARFAADNKIVGTSTISLRATKKGMAGLNEIAEANGGNFEDQNALETKSFSNEDALLHTQGQAKDRAMRQDIYNRYKGGQLDFSSMKETLNALDNAKTVKKFSDAVDKFAGSVDEKAGDKDKGFKPLFGSFSQHNNLGTQKTIK